VRCLLDLAESHRRIGWIRSTVNLAIFIYGEHHRPTGTVWVQQISRIRETRWTRHILTSRLMG
jgi:hypothetical protein